MGGGGGDIAAPAQHKRLRSDDVLCDKLKAVQVTSAESDATIPNTTPNSVSYASMLLNPMSNYGNAAIDDVEFSDEDCTYSGNSSVPTACTFKKSDEQPVNEAPVNPVTSNVSADVHMTLTTKTPDPTVSPDGNEESTSNSHGPWMLMSYKNRKRESTANGNTKGLGASGSRFSILETDEDEYATSAADNTKTPVTPKKSNSELLPSSSSKSRKASSHPMKDITNGLPVGTKDKKLGPGKPRKSVTGSKMVKGSTADVKPFSISLPNAPSIFKTTNPATSLANVPASFGHCPPEIDPGANTVNEDSDYVHASTAQVCSDFASDTFNMAANIPMMVPLVDSSDEETSMGVDMSSSMEENMIIS
ncbi:hypothetical protein M0R45_001031 [Rubus argutus]|uniref:Uncharacterized protein n=1 Tax=Rubus argutus TaxID=59490 RepID=A0AAW1VP18_RUBAR